MPQIYSDLNPNSGIDTNPKANLNVSQGYQADTSFGSIIKGASDVLEMGVKLVDDSIQRNIKNEAYKEIDLVRAEYGVDAVAQTQAQAGQKVLPKDLEASFDNIKDLQRGRSQGSIKDSHYWGRLETVSRQLRARYPGYREEIDRTVSGITGANPANKIVAELATELKDGQTEEQKKLYAYEKDNEPWLAQIGYFDSKNQGKPIPFNIAQREVAQLKLNKQHVELEQAKLNLVDKRDDTRERNVERVARTDLNLSVGSAMLPYMRNLESLQGKSDEEIKRSGGLSPETEATLRANFTEINRQAAKVVEDRLNTKEYMELPPARKEALRKDALASLQSTTDAYLNKEFGTFNVRSNAIKAATDNAELIATKDSFFVTGNAVKRLLGDVSANEFYRMNEKVTGGLTPAQRLHQNVAASRMVVGESNISAEVKTLADKGVGDEVIKATVKSGIEHLKSPNLPTAAFNNQVEAYFGKGASVDSVLSMGKTKKDRAAIYQMWTDPTIAKRVQEEAAKSGDNTTANKYNRWISDGFATVFSTELSDLKSKFTYDNTVEVKFDEPTLTFRAVPRAIPEGEFGLRQSQSELVAMSGTISRAWNSDSLASINTAIKSMVPVWKATGVDPKQGINNIMRAAGVTDSNEKAPSGMVSAFQMLNKTWIGQVGNIFDDVVAAEKKLKGDTKLKLSMEELNKYFKDNPVTEKDIKDLDYNSFDLSSVGGIVQLLNQYNLKLTNRLSSNVEDVRGAGTLEKTLKGITGAISDARAVYPKSGIEPEDFGLTSPEDDTPILRGSR